MMERTDVLELMSTLKLYGMRAAYDEVMATGIKRRHEPPRIVGDLLSAEIAEKQARSIKYQLTIAKLPLAKDVDGFEFKGTPINEAVCRFAASPSGGSLRDGARSRRRRLHYSAAQCRPGWWDRNGQDTFGDGDRAKLHSRRITRPVLQYRRSGQST